MSNRLVRVHWMEALFSIRSIYRLGCWIFIFLVFIEFFLIYFGRSI